MKMADLKPLFQPRSIAVIGASAKGGRATGAIRNLKELGFSGDIYPVNPKYDEVMGYPCYPSLDAIPGTVDLVCIGIPSEEVAKVLDEAHLKGIPAAVIFASGYAEAGVEGGARQVALEDFARRTGMAICGPNCLGVLNFQAGSCAYTSISPAQVRRGDVALLSQSGSVLVAMVCSLRGIGFSHMVSSGNEAVLTGADYLGYFVDDPQTRVIAAYLEGIKDPQKFAAVADRALEAGKPLIVLKSGRSAGGSAASAAHTGSLAGSYEVQCAIFRQRGVVQCADLDEFSEAMEMFRVSRRIPSGHGVGLFGISGGENALVMDIAAEQGVEIRPLTDNGKSRLAKLLPWYARPENPIDPTGAMLDNQEVFIGCLEVLADEPHIDIILVSQDSPAAFDLVIAKNTVAAAQRIKKPIVFFNNFSGPWNPDIIEMLRDAGVPYLQGIRESLGAVKAYLDYHVRRAQIRGRLSTAVSAPSRAREDALRILGTGGTVLTEDASKTLLALYDFPVPLEILVHSKKDAVAAAERAGYPVVAKVVSADLPHKAAVGGVRLDLRSPADLEIAYEEILQTVNRNRPDANISGVLIQHMVKGGVEIILGLKRDEQFGPIVVFGLGGIFVEAIRQVSLRAAPLCEQDAAEMIDEVPAFGRLLEKLHAGSNARELVQQLLMKLSQLAVDIGDRVEEIDINPVILDPGANRATVVDALIVPRIGPGSA
jgi:acetate---CoA ligase (ADP-forming)